MKTSGVLSYVTIFMLTVLAGTTAQAQTSEPPSKIEVGVQFTSLSYPRPSVFGLGAAVSPGYPTNEAGFGGRFTFNFNRYMALEAEANFFPHSNFLDPATSGKLLQAQFGIKAGKRFSKFGLFGKARPGIASFSNAFEQVGIATGTDPNGQPYTFPTYGYRRRTNFSMDLGGVLEFYPSRKVLTRLDVGDTIMRHRIESFYPLVLGLPKQSRTSHNLQVSAGIGFRFGSLQPESAAPQVQPDGPERFEVGAQFSSLILRQVEHFAVTPIQGPFPDFRDFSALAGAGGRFTFNINSNVALEVQSDFYPTDLRVINNGRVGGKTLQGQAGIKAGKRFERFGIFAKARPGLVSFSKAIKFAGFDPVFGFPLFVRERKTYFSMDIGGVLEFYPSRSIVTRFDGGDTLIHYREFNYPIAFLPPEFFHTPAETTHNFQFSAGVGWRF